MEKLIRFGIFLVVLSLCQICFSQQQPSVESTRKDKVDSLLNTYSVEEVLRYREHYQKKIDELREEKLKLREKGIHDAETFVANNPDSKVLDKVLVRLAELYYEVADDEYLLQMQEYDQKIEQAGSSETDSTLKEPVKDFSKSLSLYQRIIDEFPHSDLVDDALYNKGFILEERGEINTALEIYHYLIKEYPKSRYVPESLIRIAEYYFNPPRNEIQTAIEYYKKFSITKIAANMTKPSIVWGGAIIG